MIQGHSSLGSLLVLLLYLVFYHFGHFQHCVSQNEAVHTLLMVNTKMQAQYAELHQGVHIRIVCVRITVTIGVQLHG